MVERTLKITGLDCVDCARGLESSVASLPSVEEATLHFYNGTLNVQGDVDERELRKMIMKLGYGVEDGDSQERVPADDPNALVGFWRYLLQRVETQLALIGGGILLLSLILTWFGSPDWVSTSLQIAALAAAGLPIARNGLVNLWVNHTFNINFLMTMAGIGAVIIGEYVEAASLIVLFDLAEALEGFTNVRTRSAISRLTDLVPTHAIRLISEDEAFVPVEDLSIGDRILVRPGERIPMDGVVVEGQSDINQAPITGESIPVW
jgi:Cd2+/Zn2+-exporting ATPase